MLAIAVALILSALRRSIVFFNSPSDVVEQKVAPGTRIRSAGWSTTAASKRGDDSRELRRHRRQRDHPGHLHGILPDLFREGQGVVAEGVLADGGFAADTVLAKHDERYMPTEVVEA